MTKIDLFCGISSLGMPFPRENKEHVGYSDIVKRKLEELGYQVEDYNISKLNKNHTWDLMQHFEQSHTLANIRILQMKSINELRGANGLFKLVIPKGFQYRYNPKSEENQIFRDIYINADNPIFIYSGGENDFFTFIQSGPVELMNEAVRNDLPDDLESLVVSCIDNVEENWLLLKSLNPNVKICALGFYYAPIFSKIAKVIHFQDKLNHNQNDYGGATFDSIINLYNFLLEQRSEGYDFVEYIDISFIKDYCAPLDFHPNTLGNELIADEVMEVLQDKFTLEIDSDVDMTGPQIKKLIN